MRQQIFRLLADLRFAIFILLLISFCSIIGTIIEQEQSIETYKLNYPVINPLFGFLSWDRILQLNLDHVYKTWWFVALIFLFGVSLTLCSLLQQLPSLKIARRCQFFRATEQFYNLKVLTAIETLSFYQILSRLKKTRYSIFQQKNVAYCYKGLVGRFAPVIVHFSMILILLGTILGSLFGFKAQEIVPTTETFHIQNMLGTGPFTRITPITGRINDFWITYTRQKTVSQFYSDLSILDETGKEIIRKTIKVNYPLIYKNIYYYQTDWSLVGVRLQTLNSNTMVVEYPLIQLLKAKDKIWLTWIPDTFTLKQGILIILDNIEGYSSIYNEKGQFLGNLELNEKIERNMPIPLLEVISSTGLQVKTDPGIGIIYAGFFLLMLSTLISYISYSQIWILQKKEQIFVGGTTNRAQFEFELEFFKLTK